MPSLSVIAPYDGSPVLPYFLKALGAQTLSGEEYELILGCEADAQPRSELLSRYQFQISVVLLPRVPCAIQHSAALLRNRAALKAKGHRLVFIDTDCIVATDCLEHHRNARPSEVLCGTRHEILTTTFGMPVALASYDQAEAQARVDVRLLADVRPPNRAEWEDFWSCNSSVSVEHFLDVGLFDESGFRCHDLDLGYRLSRKGLPFIFDRSCHVIHVEHPRSVWYRRAQVEGLTWLAQRYPEAAPIADSLIATFRAALYETLGQCERYFSRLCKDLPGFRVSLAWITPCGYDVSEVEQALVGCFFVRDRQAFSTRLFLRLHETCWDYSILIPDLDTALTPQISIVVNGPSQPVSLEATLTSIFLQTMQSFEVILICSRGLGTSTRFRGSSRLRVISGHADEQAGHTIREQIRCRGTYRLDLRCGDVLDSDMCALLLSGQTTRYGNSFYRVNGDAK